MSPRVACNLLTTISLTGGGHSISAARLIARINQAFDVQWPVSVLFQRPTVRELAVNLGGLPVQQVARCFTCSKSVIEYQHSPIGADDWEKFAVQYSGMPTLLGDIRFIES